jgi:hypothetical protein
VTLVSASRHVAAPTGRAVPLVAVARGCEAALDVTVVLLATWTVVYHVCLLTGLGVTAAVVLEVSALAAYGGLRWRLRHAPFKGHSARAWQADGASTGRAHSQPRDRPQAERKLVGTAAACGAIAAALVAVNAGWPAIAGLWLVTALAGTAWAVLRLGRATGSESAPDGPEGGPRRQEPWSVVVALAWATVLAALSALTVWPNPDDLYYVNLSQWIVDHGSFPLRDTIFSNLEYPMSSWPPMASYDALTGVVARLADVHAASVVYLVVPPVATFLSVLALWRLLTTWRVHTVGLALSVALLFLLFDGGPGYAAPGNLFLIRIWQGKVILLCLMVPILLVYALRYVERPTWHRAGWLFMGGIAAVGLTTSAMFLVPLIALSGAAPLMLRRPWLALRGFAAMAAYPLLAGATTVAVGGRSADLFGTRELYRFDPSWFGHEIFRDGPLALLAVAAVLGGAFWVPHSAARVTTGVLTFITGLTLVPGVTHLSYELVGLGPTLWRVSWVASIAALVGVLAVRVAAYPARRSLRLIAPLALVVTVVLFGLPIWSGRNGVLLQASPQWKRGPDSIIAAEQAIAAVRPGELILAPDDLAITIDVLTTKVKTVAPRDYFMDYLRHNPRFHYADRLMLVRFANQLISLRYKHRVTQALNRLGVREVCLPVVVPDDPATPRAGTIHRARLLRAHGWSIVASSDSARCFTQ